MKVFVKKFKCTGAYSGLTIGKDFTTVGNFITQ